MHDQRSKSGGPKTIEGKRNSSKNATTHGCLSREKILPGESQQEYDALWQKWLDKYQPSDNLDLDLLGQLVMAPGVCAVPNALSPKWKARCSLKTSMPPSGPAKT